MKEQDHSVHYKTHRELRGAGKKHENAHSGKDLSTLKGMSSSEKKEHRQGGHVFVQTLLKVRYSAMTSTVGGLVALAKQKQTRKFHSCPNQKAHRRKRK